MKKSEIFFSQNSRKDEKEKNLFHGSVPLTLTMLVFFSFVVFALNQLTLRICLIDPTVKMVKWIFVKAVNCETD
jgi:hypothetical protein